MNRNKIKRNENKLNKRICTMIFRRNGFRTIRRQTDFVFLSRLQIQQIMHFLFSLLPDVSDF